MDAGLLTQLLRSLWRELLMVRVCLFWGHVDPRCLPELFVPTNARASPGGIFMLYCFISAVYRGGLPPAICVGYKRL